jgi:hypothetical protein
MNQTIARRAKQYQEELNNNQTTIQKVIVITQK